MDKETKEKLDKLLNENKIDKKTYDEILSRFNKKEPDENNKNENNNESDNNFNNKDTNENNKENKNDEDNDIIHISGIGSLNNVRAGSLIISGLGRIKGNVNTRELKISGAAEFSKDINSEKVHISGAIHGKINLNSDDITVSGRMEINNISCNNIKISGSASINNLKSDKIYMSGEIKSEYIESDYIETSGILQIKKIKCNEMVMELYSGHSKIDEIDANKIKITAKDFKHKSFNLFTKQNGYLSSSYIKCSDIYAENLKASKIISVNAVIGDNCTIDYLEAKTMNISENAIVREKKFI